MNKRRNLEKEHQTRADDRSRAHIAHLQDVIASIPKDIPTAGATRDMLQQNIDNLKASLTTKAKKRKAS